MNAQHSYPMQEMPTGIFAAIRDVALKTKSPVELSAMAALGTLSLAGQDMADVRMSHGSIVPTSLSFTGVAPSGARKTATVKPFSMGVKQFEEKKEAEYSEEKRQYDTENLIWITRTKSLKKAMLKAGTRGEEKLKAAEEEFRKHFSQKPNQPHPQSLMFQDSTPEAIAWNLHAAHPSAGLISDEAGMVLNGRAAGQLPLLNALWDGADIRVNRKDSDSFTLRGGRLTIALMLQEDSFKKFLQGRGALSRDNGFLARTLICYPMSLAGTRMESSIEEASCDSVTRFNDRIFEMLESSQKARKEGRKTRPVIELSPDAKVHLRDYGNFIESHLVPGGYYHGISDAASKNVENAVRMAALFHLYENREGLLGEDLVRAACNVSRWYLDEFWRVFSAPPQLPLHIQDPWELDQCLRRLFMSSGRYQYSRSMLQAYAPIVLRKNRSRLMAAVETLINQGIMGRFQPHGSRHIVFTLFPSSYPFNPGVPCV